MDWPLLASFAVAFGALCAAAWSVFQIAQRAGAGSRYDRWRNIRESLAQNTKAYKTARDEEERALIALVSSRDRLPAVGMEVFWAFVTVVVTPLIILWSGVFLGSPDGAEVLAWSDLTWWAPTLEVYRYFTPLLSVIWALIALYTTIHNVGVALREGEQKARSRLGLVGKDDHLRYRSMQPKSPSVT